MADPQHHDSYAWTWEPAAAVLLAVSAAGILAVQLGRSLALLLSGAGWWWPDSTMLFTSLGPILTGDTLAGLTPTHTLQPAPAVLGWTLAGTVFLITLTLTAWITAKTVAGARNKGMATTTEATRLLGVARLRANRHIIRPDLYRKIRR